MNELRWILLVAGVILIAAVYLWGMRARVRPPAQQGGAMPEPVAPTTATNRYDADDIGEDDAEGSQDEEDTRYARPALSRRIEPSVSLDEAEADFPSHQAERRAPGFSAPPASASAGPAAARREPTLGPAREEPAAPRHVEPEDSPPAPAAAAAKPQRPAHKIIAIRVSATPPARFEGRQLREALQAEGLAFGKYEIFHHLHNDGRPVFSAASLREPGTFDLEEMATAHYPGIALFAVLPGPVAATEAFDQMLYTARALATLLQGALADERGVPLTTLRVGKLREDVLAFERSLSGDGPAG
jgi:cell division protein ZipA